MNKKIKLIIIVITLILGVLLVNHLKYRNDELYAVNLKNEIDKDLVSILVSDGSENYTKYEGNTFPSNTEYTYNSELSKCQDNNGNVIEGILSYDEESGKVNIRTKKTTYCYLYFDIIPSEPLVEKLITSGELWQSGLEGDGYRYIGSGKVTDSTSPNNFICFGTTSLSECKANEEKYMYRIIGVFPDESGEQHIKVIKYKQLTEAYSWHSDIYADVSWEESDLYKGLNGISGGSYNNLFIGNTTYDYLQDNKWLNKIADWKWTAANTMTWTNGSDKGPDYYVMTTKQIYLHEMNRSLKTNSIGEWTYPIAKIGLMNASDYQMSLGNNSLLLTGSSNGTTLKTGWLHPSNNDNAEEWLLTRYENRYDWMCSWIVDENGGVSREHNDSRYKCSPAFYLDPKVSILDGTGSYSNPYLIKK